jgi:hypothetical protein
MPRAEPGALGTPLLDQSTEAPPVKQEWLKLGIKVYGVRIVWGDIIKLLLSVVGTFLAALANKWLREE